MAIPVLTQLGHPRRAYGAIASHGLLSVTLDGSFDGERSEMKCAWAVHEKSRGLWKRRRREVDACQTPCGVDPAAAVSA